MASQSMASCESPVAKEVFNDHAHSWTAYGILDGTEILERYRRIDDGTKEGHAKLELESVTEGKPGKVDLVPPFDPHAEQGGPEICRHHSSLGTGCRQSPAGQLQYGEQHRPADRRPDEHTLRDYRLRGC